MYCLIVLTPQRAHFDILICVAANMKNNLVPLNRYSTNPNTYFLGHGSSYYDRTRSHSVCRVCFALRAKNICSPSESSRAGRRLVTLKIRRHGTSVVSVQIMRGLSAEACERLRYGFFLWSSFALLFFLFFSQSSESRQ